MAVASLIEASFVEAQANGLHTCLKQFSGISFVTGRWEVKRLSFSIQCKLHPRSHEIGVAEKVYTTFVICPASKHQTSKAPSIAWIDTFLRLLAIHLLHTIMAFDLHSGIRWYFL